MQHQFLSSIDDIDPAQWNRLCATDYPFLRHEFFAALENSGSTVKATGWEPHHLVVKDNQNIIAVMPLFLKYHSYGEYVFDWAWADAYHRHNIAYYPKLINAIPFTPATGPRWGIDASSNSDLVLSYCFAAINAEVEQQLLSSCHCLFTTDTDNALFKKLGYLERLGCQYHWLNQGYGSFEAFLDTFTSRKRKNVNKERRCVSEQAITLHVKEGIDISAEEWNCFYHFYHATYFKRSGRHGYLTADFFPLLAKSMAERLLMVQAKKDHQLIAAALYFKDSHTLYGRYWGCEQEYDHLHFEACYYQGIEYAIQHQLQRFDPGAQGEHKIQRGFTPVFTYSHHHIADIRFRNAIQHFLQSERQQIIHYRASAAERLPFKTPNQ
jgi:predicted N-acyltransferase